MLTFTTTQVGAQSARSLRAPHPYLIAVLLLVTTFSYGQPAGPPGAPPGAGGPPGRGGPPGAGGPPDGDPPALVGRPKLSDKAPKPSADPRNLEGVWYHFGSRAPGSNARDLYGARVAFTEEGRKILSHRRDMEKAGTPLTNPASRCYPAPTWNFAIDAPFHIVQTDDLIYFLFQEFHAVWQIHMNPRNSAPGERTFSGYSVGHWDGSTLVVDTVNFKEPQWLDTGGTPASKDARLTHRIRKLEDGRGLEVITTVTDPQMYATPWATASVFAWTPNAWMLGEYNCEQQVGGSGGAASNYGLTEDEPASK